MNKTAIILRQVLRGERLSTKDALLLFKEADLISLGLVASELRSRLHPGNKVTFVIDRNINYTNVCTSKCRFCAFYREEGSPEAYLLAEEEVFAKIEEAQQLGATQIMLQGGLHPSLDINYFVGTVRRIKERFSIHLHSFSPPEIAHISEVSGISVGETLQKLKEAGLDSLPGGGAEILADEVRSLVSPKKIDSHLWLRVMEEAHQLGLPSTATMMFGSVERYEHRLEHLHKIRSLQDRTSGFTAFIPWTFQPGHTALGGSGTSSSDYLRTLAISRIFLNNIPNIQASWVTQGSKVGQVALSFGANDLGSTMIEENVVRATGISYRMSKGEMIKAIKEAGMIPAQRNTLYDVLRVFE